MFTRYLLLAFLTTLTSLSLAAQPTLPQGCAPNSAGDIICSPPGGEVMTNTTPQVVTGKGECATDSNGKVTCASTPGGGAATNTFGDVVTGRGKCLADQYGQVKCAGAPGGGAEIDSTGAVKTGPGQCVKETLGHVMCSSIPGGGVSLNINGQAVCKGGCVAGQ